MHCVCGHGSTGSYFGVQECIGIVSRHYTDSELKFNPNDTILMHLQTTLYRCVVQKKSEIFNVKKKSACGAFAQKCCETMGGKTIGTPLMHKCQIYPRKPSETVSLALQGDFFFGFVGFEHLPVAFRRFLAQKYPQRSFKKKSSKSPMSGGANFN